MYEDDPNLMKTELWGENLLGKALMEVRENIDDLCVKSYFSINM